MKKFLSVAAAMSLAFALTGCSKDTTPTVPATTPTQSMTSTSDTPSETPSETPTSDTPSDIPSETPSQTPSAPGSPTASVAPTGTTGPAGSIDQSTPEAAMTGWLNAMMTGDSANVCALMASGDQAIADIPNAVKACGSTIEPMLKGLTPLKEMFKDLDIKGATVSGDKASFDSVTTTPVLAAQIIKQFKAVKLSGKWFITQ